MWRRLRSPRRCSFRPTRLKASRRPSQRPKSRLRGGFGLFRRGFRVFSSCAFCPEGNALPSSNSKLLKLRDLQNRDGNALPSPSIQYARGAFQTARSCHSPQLQVCHGAGLREFSNICDRTLRPAEIAQTPAGAGRRRGDGARGGAAVATIMAPMPGKVVRVLVAPGAAVGGPGNRSGGSQKMQNELKAPRGPRDLSRGQKRGATVAAGENAGDDCRVAE